MFTILMVGIPCIGFIYMIVGAFWSQNESRRNFYRAHLAYLAIIVSVYATLFVVGEAPDIRKLYRRLQHEQALENQRSSSKDSAKTKDVNGSKNSSDSE